MMTRDQIDLVQHSFALVQPITAQAAALFYDKLFERDPAVRALFRGDMAAQGQKLMTMIGAAVALLGRPEQLDAALVALGRRHVGYGATPAHYDTVGAALLDTLAAGLGDAFTADVRQAWASMYGYVARTMIDASVVPLEA